MIKYFVVIFARDRTAAAAAPAPAPVYPSCAATKRFRVTDLYGTPRQPTRTKRGVQKKKKNTRAQNQHKTFIEPRHFPNNRLYTRRNNIGGGGGGHRRAFSRNKLFTYVHTRALALRVCTPTRVVFIYAVHETIYDPELVDVTCTQYLTGG